MKKILGAILVLALVMMARATPAFAWGFNAVEFVDDSASTDWEYGTGGKLVVVRPSLLETITITLPNCENGRTGFILTFLKQGLGNAVITAPYPSDETINGNTYATLPATGTSTVVCLYDGLTGDYSPFIFYSN